MGNSVFSQQQQNQQQQPVQNMNTSCQLEPVRRTATSSVVTVIVDDQIQFEVDITDQHGEKTCGWLLAEVTRKYTLMLNAIQRREARSFQTAQNGIGGRHHLRQDVRMPRHKRRYIMALKTEDEREGIDSWLNQYERDLSVLKDGQVLIAHFANVNLQTGINLTQKKEVTISDFEQIKVVGRGGFSRVVLARKKDTGRLYAIKILKKSELTSQNAISPILSERMVLEQLKHPFLVKLHWAFQSSRELYFVMDICTGGELFYHLIEHKRFSERTAKFFMSEILLGFKYLHDLDIVYRDVKPENILIDMDGHVRIADFGLAKVICEDERSYSFCGSPEYLCPEMLQEQGEGHDRRLDIYSLGVLLYEMLTGLPPFYDDDQAIMLQKIVSEELVLDQPYLSPLSKDLLSNMLEKDPVLRQQSIEQVMQHQWFADVDWSLVHSKQVKPPIIPDISSSYFENVDSENDDYRHSRISRPGEMDISRTAARRQSYYVHSTVQLPSCIDEQASFLRTQSQMRMLLDQSAAGVSNGDESRILQNLQTSQLEGSQLVNRSMLLQHLHRTPCSNRESSEILNLSQLDQARQRQQSELEGPAQKAADAFANFNYASPPLAEIQILRVLETFLVRKKKDQLEYARKCREKLLQQREGFLRGSESRQGPEAQAPLTSLRQASLPTALSRQKQANRFGQASQSVNSYKNRNLARGGRSQFAKVVEAEASESHFKVRDVQESIGKDESQAVFEVLSDSDIYNTSQRKRREDLLPYGEEFQNFQNQDTSLLELQGYQDESKILQKVIAEIPNTDKEAARQRCSSTHSLTSFRQEESKRDISTPCEEKNDLFFLTQNMQLNRGISAIKKNPSVLQADLSKIEFNQRFSAHFSHDSESSCETFSEQENQADLQKQYDHDTVVKGHQQNFIIMDPSKSENSIQQEDLCGTHLIGVAQVSATESVEISLQSNRISPNRNHDSALYQANHQSLKERLAWDSLAVNQQLEPFEQGKEVFIDNQPFRMPIFRRELLLGEENKPTGSQSFKSCTAIPKNRTENYWTDIDATESSQTGTKDQLKTSHAKNKVTLGNGVASIDTLKQIGDDEETPARQRTIDSDGGLTFGGIPFRISAASESDHTLENANTGQSLKGLGTRDSKISSNQSGGLVKNLKLQPELSPVREKLKRQAKKKEDVTSSGTTDRKLRQQFSQTAKLQIKLAPSTMVQETSQKGKKQSRNSGKITPAKKSKKLSGQSKMNTIVSQPLTKDEPGIGQLHTPKFMAVDQTQQKESAEQLQQLGSQQRVPRAVQSSKVKQKSMEAAQLPRLPLARIPSPTKKVTSFVQHSHKQSLSSQITFQQNSEIKLRQQNKSSSPSQEDDSDLADNQVADEKQSLQLSQISLQGPITGLVRTSEVGAGVASGRMSPSKIVRETMSLRLLFVQSSTAQQHRLEFSPPGSSRRGTDVRKAEKDREKSQEGLTSTSSVSGFNLAQQPIQQLKYFPLSPQETARRFVQMKLIHGSSQNFETLQLQGSSQGLERMPQKLMNFPQSCKSIISKTNVTQQSKLAPAVQQPCLVMAQSQPWQQKHNQTAQSVRKNSIQKGRMNMDLSLPSGQAPSVPGTAELLSKTLSRPQSQGRKNSPSKISLVPKGVRPIYSLLQSLGSSLKGTTPTNKSAKGPSLKKQKSSKSLNAGTRKRQAPAHVKVQLDGAKRSDQDSRNSKVRQSQAQIQSLDHFGSERVLIKDLIHEVNNQNLGFQMSQSPDPSSVSINRQSRVAQPVKQSSFSLTFKGKQKASPPKKRKPSHLRLDPTTDHSPQVIDSMPTSCANRLHMRHSLPPRSGEVRTRKSPQANTFSPSLFSFEQRVGDASLQVPQNDSRYQVPIQYGSMAQDYERESRNEGGPDSCGPRLGPSACRGNISRRGHQSCNSSPRNSCQDRENGSSSWRQQR